MIDNLYDGLGDAITYCWMVKSAEAAGIDARLNIRRWKELGEMFGVSRLLTDEESDRKKKDGGNGSPHWNREIELVREGTRLNRFQIWCGEHGLGRLDPSRPAFRGDPVALEWAERAWIDREAASGGGERVLFVPGGAWANRTTPNAIMCDAAYTLANAGLSVAACDVDKDDVDNFPFFFYGMKLEYSAALAARADVVIANDSGMAHLAGTIGVPTVAVCGMTNPDVVFGHIPEVRGLRGGHGKVWCAGCHFSPKSYRASCAKGCLALMSIDPMEIVKIVLETLKTKRRIIK